jgi:hypothetical protein
MICAAAERRVNERASIPWVNGRDSGTKAGCDCPWP